MLDRSHRLTSSADFTAASRRGRRAGARTLVLHLLAGPVPAGSDEVGSVVDARVGFVVSKSVGNSVTRNQVRRRLRHLVRERLEVLPDATRLVVRALPASATATYGGLGRDLDTALGRLDLAARTVSRG